MAKWRMKNGQEVEIVLLKDDHLVNIVRMLRRKMAADRDMITFRCIEAIDRAAEEEDYGLTYQVAEQLVEADDEARLSQCFAVYDELIQEVRRRGLEAELQRVGADC